MQEGGEFVWWDLHNSVDLNPQERDEGGGRCSFLLLGGNPQGVTGGLYASEGCEAGVSVRWACDQKVIEITYNIWVM